MDVTDPATLLAALSPGDVASRQAALLDDLETQGVTFGVKDGDGRHTGHQVFEIEPVPQIIDLATWDRLAGGVEQRSLALDRFLDDVYTRDDPQDADIVRAGLVDADLIRRSPGFTRSGHAVPAGTTRVHIVGADMVNSVGTDPDSPDRSDWRILEDNVRMPSGLTFALAARSAVSRYYPELIDTVGARLLPVTGALESFCATLRDAAPPGVDPASAHVVVLTEGDHDPTWAEQAAVARTGGFHPRTRGELVVGPDDRGHRILWDRTSGRRVDVVYLRVEEHRMPDGIDDAVADGSVAVANAPGNGLADDKAVYASVPAMVRFYLGEEPRLNQVPTWLCSEEDQRSEVLDRLSELVVKPVDGYGGAGITIGPECTRDQLDRRRAEILARPDLFIAQEKVELSVLPALDGTRRHVDLRMFSLRNRAGTSTVPAGLTRTARAGSLIVNSSRGGGGRDTWIISGSLQS